MKRLLIILSVVALVGTAAFGGYGGGGYNSGLTRQWVEAYVSQATSSIPTPTLQTVLDAGALSTNDVINSGDWIFGGVYMQDGTVAQDATGGLDLVNYRTATNLIALMDLDTLQSVLDRGALSTNDVINSGDWIFGGVYMQDGTVNDSATGGLQIVNWITLTNYVAMFGGGGLQEVLNLSNTATNDMLLTNQFAFIQIGTDVLGAGGSALLKLSGAKNTPAIQLGNFTGSHYPEIQLRGLYTSAGRYGLAYDNGNDATFLYGYATRKCILGTRSFTGTYTPYLTLDDGADQFQFVTWPILYDGVPIVSNGLLYSGGNVVITNNDARNLTLNFTNAYRSDPTGLYADNELVTYGKLSDLLAQGAGSVLYGATNDHPVISGAASLYGTLPVAQWSQEFTVNSGVSTQGLWLSTNTVVDYVPQGTYQMHFHSEASTLGDVSVSVWLVAVGSGFTNYITQTAFQELGTDIRAFDLYAHVPTNVTPPGTAYIGVRCVFTNSAVPSRTATFYGGGGYDSAVFTPNLTPAASSPTDWASYPAVTSVNMNAHSITNARGLFYGRNPLLDYLPAIILNAGGMTLRGDVTVQGSYATNIFSVLCIADLTQAGTFLFTTNAPAEGQVAKFHEGPVGYKRWYAADDEVGLTNTLSSFGGIDRSPTNVAPLNMAMSSAFERDGTLLSIKARTLSGSAVFDVVLQNYTNALDSYTIVYTGVTASTIATNISISIPVTAGECVGTVTTNLGAATTNLWYSLGYSQQ